MGRRPTIADVAKLAGVSTAAVSYALNGRPGVSGSTRARVVAAVAESGWQPSVAARSLRSSRPHSVGLVIVADSPNGGLDPFHVAFLAGHQRVLAERGIAVLLFVAPDLAEASLAYGNWAAGGRVSGLVLTDLRLEDPRLDTIASLGLPAVAVGSAAACRDLPRISHDDAAAARLVADHLLGIGHRRIALITGPADLDATMTLTETLVTAAEEHGASVVTVATDRTAAAGAAAARRLLADVAPPTALILENDEAAIATVEVARRMRLEVPWQLSIVSTQDSALCRLLAPSITSLHRSADELGAAAATALLQLLDGEDVTVTTVPTARLSVRGSTAPPSAKARGVGLRQGETRERVRLG